MCVLCVAVGFLLLFFLCGFANYSDIFKTATAITTHDGCIDRQRAHTLERFCKCLFAEIEINRKGNGPGIMY